MDCRMDNRVALITGASTGLGKAMTLRFTQSGAKVAMLARRAEVLDAARKEVEAAGGTARAYPCDVSDAAQIEKTFGAIQRDFGKVDILVNNAGQSQTAKFEEITDQIWQSDFDLKVFAAIRLARLALPGMKARRWGRIINVLNIGAKAPRAGSAPTSVSRAAGLAITKVLAGEGAPYNVLVNALMTGLIRSDQWVRRHAQLTTNQPFDDFLAAQAKAMGIPLGRFGEAEEFANIACFLASDAGSYITGTSVNVDGNHSPVV
jgi:3-oxoacyl-[acyl-carrier protein] reductase